MNLESSTSIMPAPAPDHALAKRTLELVDIASESRHEAALREYVTASVPLETAFSDGESLIYATRAQGRTVLMTTTLDGKIKARLPSQTADLREPVWGPYGR